MKTVLLALITTASIFAYAKGGGGSKPMTPERFIHEAMETGLFLAKNAGAGTIIQTSTDLVAPDTLNVVIVDANTAMYSYQCILIDDISQSGTVVKKEAHCSAL